MGSGGRVRCVYVEGVSVWCACVRAYVRARVCVEGVRVCVCVCVEGVCVCVWRMCGYVKGV
jgi:hypothetical protein